MNFVSKILPFLFCFQFLQASETAKTPASIIEELNRKTTKCHFYLITENNFSENVRFTKPLHWRTFKLPIVKDSNISDRVNYFPTHFPSELEDGINILKTKGVQCLYGVMFLHFSSLSEEDLPLYKKHLVINLSFLYKSYSSNRNPPSTPIEEVDATVLLWGQARLVVPTDSLESKVKVLRYSNFKYVTVTSFGDKAESYLLCIVYNTPNLIIKSPEPLKELKKHVFANMMQPQCTQITVSSLSASLKDFLNDNITYCASNRRNMRTIHTHSLLSWVHGAFRGRAYIFPYMDASYSFLTCYSQKKLSFQMYISPFNSTSWCAILIAITIMTVMLAVQYKLYSPNSLGVVPFVVLSSLIDDPLPIPQALEKRDSLRLVLGTWLLVCANILTTVYIGKLVLYTTAPLQLAGVTDLNEISKSQCNSTCQCHAEIQQAKDLLYEGLTLHRHDYFVILEESYEFAETYLTETSYTKRHMMLNVFFVFGQAMNEFKVGLKWDRCWTTLKNCEKRKELVGLLKASMLLHRDYDFIPKSYAKAGKRKSFTYAVEEELLECRKTVYVTTSSAIEKEKKYLSSVYTNTTFFTGFIIKNGLDLLLFEEQCGGFKEKMTQFIEGSFLVNSINAYTEKRYRSRYNNSTTHSRPFKKAVKPIKLNDSIQTVFYICSMAIVFILPVIKLEMRRGFAVSRFSIYANFCSKVGTLFQIC